MTYLLDTCVISEMVAKQPNQQVLDWLNAQVPETLYISMITIGEIAKGISKMTASKRKKSLTNWLNETLTGLTQNYRKTNHQVRQVRLRPWRLRKEKK